MIPATTGRMPTETKSEAEFDPQLLETVQIIVDVAGPLTPNTFPEPSTVATLITELLQVTPEVDSVRVIELPAQTVVGPPIAAGAEGIVFTVMLFVTKLDPQLLEEV